MSGGGGQSGETRYNWNPFMENMWAGGNGNSGLLNRAVDTLNSPYQQYGGDRVAGINWDQEQAINSIRHTALGGGAPDTAAGRNAAMELARGPQGRNQNPWAESAITPGRNAYSGMDSPYFQSMLDSGVDDIVKGYERGTSADTTRMFNLAGAFGGSAHQNAIKNNEETLGKTLNNYVNTARQGQFDRSAGLEESAIGRDLQAQQFDKNIGFSGYESALQRQLGAIPLAFQGQSLAFDAARNLMGAGDFQRSYDQSLLDQQYGDWQQSQNWERNNINWLANLLSQAQGGTGVTTQMGGYQGINPGAGILGAAALGRGMGFF